MARPERLRRKHAPLLRLRTKRVLNVLRPRAAATEPGPRVRKRYETAYRTLQTPAPARKVLVPI